MIGRNASVFNAVPPDDERYAARAAVTAGILRAGFKVLPSSHQALDADILVTWSPWKRSRREAMALHYQRAGRPVIVMENGWLSPLHIPPLAVEPYYQLALEGWNGTGRYVVGDATRWQSWGVRLQDWQPRRLGHDGYALIIGQRGHPFDDRSAPPGWHESLKLDGVDEKWIIRRGRECGVPLAKHLSGAAEVHVWSSNVATQALIDGIPVIQHGPNLMTSELASRPGKPLVEPDRAPVFERLAWAQWEAAEIATGEPFARLMDMAAA